MPPCSSRVAMRRRMYSLENVTQETKEQIIQNTGEVGEGLYYFQQAYNLVSANVNAYTTDIRNLNSIYSATYANNNNYADVNLILNAAGINQIHLDLPLTREDIFNMQVRDNNVDVELLSNQEFYSKYLNPLSNFYQNELQSIQNGFPPPSTREKIDIMKVQNNFDDKSIISAFNLEKADCLYDNSFIVNQSMYSGFDHIKHQSNLVSTRLTTEERKVFDTIIKDKNVAYITKKTNGNLVSYHKVENNGKIEFVSKEHSTVMLSDLSFDNKSYQTIANQHIFGGDRYSQSLDASLNSINEFLTRNGFNGFKQMSSTDIQSLLQLADRTTVSNDALVRLIQTNPDVRKVLEETLPIVIEREKIKAQVKASAKASRTNRQMFLRNFRNSDLYQGFRIGQKALAATVMAYRGVILASRLAIKGSLNTAAFVARRFNATNASNNILNFSRRLDANLKGIQNVSVKRAVNERITDVRTNLKMHQRNFIGKQRNRLSSRIRDSHIGRKFNNSRVGRALSRVSNFKNGLKTSVDRLKRQFKALIKNLLKAILPWIIGLVIALALIYVIIMLLVLSDSEGQDNNAFDVYKIVDGNYGNFYVKEYKSHAKTKTDALVNQVGGEAYPEEKRELDGRKTVDTKEPIYADLSFDRTFYFDYYDASHQVPYGTWILLPETFAIMTEHFSTIDYDYPLNCFVPRNYMNEIFDKTHSEYSYQRKGIQFCNTKEHCSNWKQYYDYNDMKVIIIDRGNGRFMRVKVPTLKEGCCGHATLKILLKANSYTSTGYITACESLKTYGLGTEVQNGTSEVAITDDIEYDSESFEEIYEAAYEEYIEDHAEVLFEGSSLTEEQILTYMVLAMAEYKNKTNREMYDSMKECINTGLKLIGRVAYSMDYHNNYDGIKNETIMITDCSGFISYCLISSHVPGVNQYYNTLGFIQLAENNQYDNISISVYPNGINSSDTSSWLPGDLFIMNRSFGATNHVVMYIGNEQIMECAGGGKGTIISPVSKINGYVYRIRFNP